MARGAARSDASPEAHFRTCYTDTFAAPYNTMTSSKDSSFSSRSSDEFGFDLNFDSGSETESPWQHSNGDRLEPWLESGAIALLSVEWILQTARNSTQYRLDHRDNLPLEAFCLLEDLQSLGEMTRLPIVVLSHMWLSPEHPDPHGAIFHYVADALDSLCHEKLVFKSFGVFWDYASLYQHPDPKAGIFRNDEQEGLFRQALNGMAEFYGHEDVQILQVTEFPPDYPQSYSLPIGNVCVPYYQRGWPYFESCLATLKSSRNATRRVVTGFSNSKEAGAEQGVRGSSRTSVVYRRLVVLPETFDDCVAKCTFTSRNADLPLVKRLYREFVETYFRETDRLDYSALAWSDDQVTDLMTTVVGQGYATRVTDLNLCQNQIGVDGCQMVAARVMAGDMPLLRWFGMSFNQIGNDGCVVLAPVLASMEVVCLQETGIEDLGCQALASEIVAVEQPRLTQLWISGNDKIGNAGMNELLRILRHAPVFELLSVSVGRSDDSTRQEIVKHCSRNDISIIFQ